MTLEWPSQQLTEAVTQFRDVLTQVNDELRQADLALHTLADNPGVSPARDTDWADVAENFRKAATDVRDAGFVTEFDETPYQFSLDDFLDCTQRVTVRQKISGFLEGLEKAKLAGSTMLSILQAKQAEAQASYTLLIQLIDFCSHLPAEREYVLTYFENFVWTDLELVVRPQLSEYQNILGRNITKLEQELPKVELRRSNLASVQQQVEQMNCSIEGTYVGAFVRPNRNASVKFIKQGETYSGTLTVSGGIDNPTQPIINIVLGLNGDIEFFFPRLNLRWKGKLSPNFKQMNGQVSNAQGSVEGTFSYTKTT